MNRTRFGNLIVLACMGALAACTSGGGTDTAAGNTSVDLTIAHDSTSAQAFAADRVDYVVDCDGADTDRTDTPDGVDIPDATTFSGQFEIVDTRTPPVWQALMDLPPGSCTITLSVSDEDEVVCTGTETLSIVADGNTKYDIELVCDLSIQSPVGNADVDGTFRFVTGNFCPSLYVFNAIPSVHGISGTGISDLQTRALDFDDGCNQSCDPDPPGNDPGGVVTTVSCDGGILTGGTGDGSDADNYVLDCNGQVGDITCMVDATDGDTDCDKQRMLTVTCPGANPCDGNPCDDGNDCTSNVCTPIDETNFNCTDTNLPADTVCVALGGGLCDGAGTCVGQGCTSDADCDDDNDCTQPQNCALGTGVCQPATPTNEPDGTLCQISVPDDGVCEGGSCDLFVCDDDLDCDDSNTCTDDSCNTATEAGVCVNAPNAANSCTTCANPPCVCNGTTGACEDDAPVLNSVCAQFSPDPVQTAQTCDGSSPAETCICEKPEFLAVDCELLGNSAPIPLASSVQQLGVAFAGSPATILPQDAVVLPAALICSFIGAGFSEAIVDNSFAEATYTNADISSTQLSSFLDDGTAGGALVSPHQPVTFDFGAACGDNCVGGVCTSSGNTCSLPTFTQDCSVANGGAVGTGPGIIAPTFAGSGSIPPGPIPGQLVSLTPNADAAGGLVDIGLPYSGIALNLPAVGNPPLAAGCVGGACGTGSNLAPLCSVIQRGTAASPRVMYDAVCDKPTAGGGGCTPFGFFSTLGDICKGAGIDAVADFNIPSQLPSCTVGICGLLSTPTDFFCTTPEAVSACCGQLNTDFPDATPAQLPQLPIN